MSLLNGRNRYWIRWVAVRTKATGISLRIRSRLGTPSLGRGRDVGKFGLKPAGRSPNYAGTDVIDLPGFVVSTQADLTSPRSHCLPGGRKTDCCSLSDFNRSVISSLYRLQI